MPTAEKMDVRLTIGHTPNYATVRIGAYTLYFSYSTLIGFECPQERRAIVRQNDWGPTTGKHLNALCADKSRRLPSEEFEAAVARCLPFAVQT